MTTSHLLFSTFVSNFKKLHETIIFLSQKTQNAFVYRLINGGS